jgi:hypothetical protein
VDRRGSGVGGESGDGVAELKGGLEGGRGTILGVVSDSVPVLEGGLVDGFEAGGGALGGSNAKGEYSIQDYKYQVRRYSYLLP